MYWAVLHRFDDQDDWVAISLQAIVLCSLVEVHESRLIWSILVHQGCPSSVAQSIEDTIRRHDYLELFRKLVGKAAKEFRQSSRYEKFWRDLVTLREFRNKFIHREPETPDREPGDIPEHLRNVIRSVNGNIELAFQELTNEALDHTGRK